MSVARVADWVEGVRLRTLPAAVAPVRAIGVPPWAKDHSFSYVCPCVNSNWRITVVQDIQIPS